MPAISAVYILNCKTSPIMHTRGKPCRDQQAAASATTSTSPDASTKSKNTMGNYCAIEMGPIDISRGGGEGKKGEFTSIITGSFLVTKDWFSIKISIFIPQYHNQPVDDSVPAVVLTLIDRLYKKLMRNDVVVWAGFLWQHLWHHSNNRTQSERAGNDLCFETTSIV